MIARVRAARAAGLLLAVLLLCGALWRLAGSERAGALVLGMLESAVPGLAIEGFTGTLREGGVGRLRWRGDRTALVLEDLRWELDRDCLLRLTVCLPRLAARSLAIDSPGQDGDTPLALAPLALPLDIEVGAAEIDSLRLRRAERELLHVEAIRLAGTLGGSRLTLSSLEAQAQGIALRGSARIDIEGQLPLALQATLRRGEWPALSAAAEGDLNRLGLKAELGGAWPLSITGSVEPLADGVPMHLELSARGGLALPGEAAALGTLIDARAVLDGTLRELRLALKAGTRSDWIGTNTLDGALAWSPATGIALQSATLQGEVGRLQARGSLVPGASAPWQLEARLEDACLPRWSKRNGCRLSGTAIAEGTLPATATVRLDLQGEINSLPAALRGRVGIDAAKTLLLEDVALRSAGNSLQLSGSAGASLALEGRLLLESLGKTLPGASGRGQGNLRIGGTREQPTIDAAVELAELAWKGTAIERLEARLVGSRAAHALSGSLRTGALAIAFDCRGEGASTTPDWSGRCSRLDLKTPEGLPDWQLAQSLQLDWNAAARRLSIDPFCLRSRQSSACSTQRIRAAPEALEGIALRAEELPLDLLRDWLPSGSTASGSLAIALQASRRGSGPLQLQGSLSSPLLRLEPLAAGEEVPVELRELAITLRREGEALKLGASALLGQDGRILAALEAAGAQPSAALSGHIRLGEIDVGALMRMVPGSLEGGGRLGGEIRLGGELERPTLAGEIAIGGGRLSHEALPQPVEDFSLALRFAGTDALFDGEWRTRAGSGEIDGALRWAGEDWSARLRLHAEDLLLEPRRGTRVHVAPDITVELDPTLARIGGALRVPRAEIDLESLPESAVSVSRDTVIAGQQRAEPGIDYALAVDLLPGEHVQLRGFGADARLGGALRLLREPGSALTGQGELDIREGRYTAYGQRLEVTEGKLLFNGALTRPALRITAVRRIEDEPVTVGVQVRGTAKSPELKVFSRPTMPEGRALHYLLTGRAPAAGTDNELAASSALMQIGIAGAGKVTGKVLGKLGIADFQLDSRKVDGGTEVQLSGYLTPDIYLRYGVSTFSKVNTLRVRYRLSPRVFVEAVSGAESAVDFLYSFSR